MTKAKKIYQEIKENLEANIISDLFELPAFRLDKKKANILKLYAFNQFTRNISNKEFDIAPIIHNIDKAEEAKKDTNLYNFRGSWKQITITLKILPIRVWISLILSVLFAISSYFLFRQNYIWFKLAGVIAFLVFTLLFFFFFIESQYVYASVQNTFAYLRKISKRIQDYINNICLANGLKKIILKNKEKIEYLSSIIVEEFIEEEIRQINFRLKDIYLFPIIFAFLNTFMAAWISGDNLVFVIQKITELTNLIDAFPIIKNLNLQTFSIFVLFPFSIACGRYIAIEASRKRSNALHQSLFLLRLKKNIPIEDWSNLSTKANQIVESQDRLSSSDN